MIKGVTHVHLGPIWIIQNLETSPIPQTSFLVGTFFVASYSKTALGSQMALALYYETLKIEEYVMLC